MTLPPLEGHDSARDAVWKALVGGRLPQTLLLHGPPGVGKQRFALWMGQALLCGDPGADGPCGSCTGCRMALGIRHPDLHWYLPVPKPRSRGSKERDEEALEEVRQEALARFRSEPLRPSHHEEVRGLHLGTIRNLRREAGRRPSLGARRLFLVADAEELVAQESAQEAANALLKILEEPPEGTWFVLTSSEPGRLLATIRSRATALHLPPLPRDRVRAFLEREGGIEPVEAARVAALSDGSIGRALGFLAEGDEPGPLERVRQEARGWLHAALSRRDADRYARALGVQPFGARGLQELFVALEGWIRDLAAVATDPAATLLNEDYREWLATVVSRRPVTPERAARAVLRIERTRAAAAGNVNPQLLVGVLLLELHDLLARVPAPGAGAATESVP